MPFHSDTSHFAQESCVAMTASLPRGPTQRKPYAPFRLHSFAATLLQVLGCHPGAGFTHHTDTRLPIHYCRNPMRAVSFFISLPCACFAVFS